MYCWFLAVRMLPTYCAGKVAKKLAAQLRALGIEPEME